jgi:hypothetical protein
MARFNSKAKGSGFERKLCRAVSLFWSGGIHSDLCWRSAASGARGTTTRTKTAGYHGDLVATDPSIDGLFRVFCFEAKHYKEFDVTEVVRGNLRCKLLGFWRQAMRSARLAGRFPVLIVKPNFFDELLFVETGVAEAFRSCMRRAIRFISIGGKISMFRLQDFFDNVDRQAFLTTVSDMGVRLGTHSCR